jgi:DNA repair exonuclease SbcCD ATPase subunit
MIVFKNIRFRNLLSYGNYWTEISLNEYNKTLIVGTNGSGKSSIIEALTFVLYGKPFRKINKPQLINSITKKELVVELDFIIGSDDYKIIRGIKPAIFEIHKNNELLNQTGESKDYQEILETQILRKNYRTFSQIDVLASSKFVSFMELSAPQRREVVEDLLDLQIFSNMNTIAKNQLKDINESINTLERNYDVAKLTLDAINKVKESSKQVYLEEIQSRQDDIKSIEQCMDLLTNQIAEIDIEMLEYGEIESTKELIEQKNKIVESISKLQYKAEIYQKDIDFFNNNDSCPTCLQKIEQSFMIETIEDKSDKITEFNEIEIKLENKKNILNSSISDIENKNKILFSLENKKKNLIQQHYNKEQDITTENKKIALIYNKIENINDTTEELVEKQKEIKELVEKLNHDKEIKKRLNLILSSLKDTGVKALIIKEYIPILNKLINDYLIKMDFMVSFELTETFEEIIKSRYRDEFTYASFSEGQKTRITLSIILAFRQIAQLRNSVPSNLLILDEILNGSLDDSGQEVLLDILKNITNMNNIIVISHQTDNIIDSFDRVLEFSLNKNFSQMKELS